MARNVGEGKQDGVCSQGGSLFQATGPQREEGWEAPKAVPPGGSDFGRSHAEVRKMSVLPTMRKNSQK